MDEGRIKIAERNFTRYLEDKLLEKVQTQNKIILQTYLRNAQESLMVAEKLFQEKTSPLWVVVTSYYSMFYMACAYLYKLGYKSKGEIVHQVINETLIVQARHKIKNYLLENYGAEKAKALIIVDNHLTNYEREKGKRTDQGRNSGKSFPKLAR